MLYGSMSLLTNLPALVAENNLNSANSALNTSLRRLSSGLRINTPADDPAGYVLSAQQQAQIAGLNAANNNVNKAVNVMQTAGGALNQISALLLQILGAATDAANAGASNPSTLAADQALISNAVNTINSIATTTQFGTSTLIDGTHGATAATGNALYSAQAQGTVNNGSYALSVTAGTGTAATVTGGANVNTSGSAETLTINNVQIAVAASSNLSTQLADINAVTSSTGVAAVNNGNKIILYATTFGSGHTISVSSSAGTSSVTGLTAAGTSSVDGINIQGSIGGYTALGVGNVLTATSGPAAGVSVTVSPDSTTTYNSATNNPYTVDTTGATVTVSAGNPFVFQVGPNGGQTSQYSMPNAQASALGQNVSTVFTSLAAVNVTNPANSAAALTVINKAISDVANMAGMVGGYLTNTLQATSGNLQTELQNMTAANSLIRDTNFATETANYTQLQVLVQAGTQVLKNANQLPSMVLTLLA